MATINLGNLTFTHKGDYAGGTAYVKNDVVYYATNGNSYIAKTSTTGNAPTSTAHWDLFVAGASGIWNAGLSLGSASQSLRVNSGGNALEFGADVGGKLLQVKELVYQGLHGVNQSSYNIINANFKVDITPTAADSKFLLEMCLGLGKAHHDTGCGIAFMDSQVATSGDSNAIPTPNSDSGNYGSRTPIAFAGITSSASDGSTDDYELVNAYASILYTPSSQNTNQRTFYPAVKRNAYSYNTYINYGQNNHGASMASKSMIRVSEIANSIT